MTTFLKGEESVAGYYKRTAAREKTLMTATMSFVGYFMSSPINDTQADAELKVSQISTEIAPFLYVYTLGNSTPLFDAINASVLVQMDATAKAALIALLTPTV